MAFFSAVPMHKDRTWHYGSCCGAITPHVAESLLQCKQFPSTWDCQAGRHLIPALPPLSKIIGVIDSGATQGNGTHPAPQKKINVTFSAMNNESAEWTGENAPWFTGCGHTWPLALMKWLMSRCEKMPPKAPRGVGPIVTTCFLFFLLCCITLCHFVQKEPLHLLWNRLMHPLKRVSFSDWNATCTSWENKCPCVTKMMSAYSRSHSSSRGQT